MSRATNFRRSSPNSDWCGTREAAERLNIPYNRLRHLRHHPAFNGVVFPSPGGRTLDWRKSKLDAAWEKLCASRTSTQTGGEAA